MIRSALIKPLVAPLVGRGASGRRVASGLSRSRIAATALAVSALIAATAPSEASAKSQDTAPAARTAHSKPTRLVAAPKLADLFVAAIRRLSDELARPSEGAAFEHEALDLSRYRHRTDRARDGGGLGVGRRLDRLIGCNLAFKTFGSARILAAQPHS